jgi:hypothetical protein
VAEFHKTDAQWLAHDDVEEGIWNNEGQGKLDMRWRLVDEVIGRPVHSCRKAR